NHCLILCPVCLSVCLSVSTQCVWRTSRCGGWTSRSAFSVALTNTRRCEGPFREAKTIVYQYIFVNLGEGYNNRTGIFTVPRSGVYSLALTVYSDSGAPGANLAACANLMVNGRQVAGCSEQNQQDQEDSTTTVMAIQLQAGDKLSVTLPIGCFLCDEQSHYNTFSGFLLYGPQTEINV
uniref:C1q domain-containing protein n=1 Tax=Oncorhynchus tshawytscha TaxID=74940 RepID=A0A8C8G4G2_ONCTS